MKEGDIVRVVKKDGETQSYVPWGHVCELVKGFQEYAVILYKGNEYLMSKKVLEAVSENG